MSASRPTATEFLSSAYNPHLEREFFVRVILPNGSVKTTTEHRLDDLNELALPLIRQLPQPLKIMDVAASSGVSTAEWLEQLSGVRCEMTATDLTVTAWRVKPHSWLEALIDDSAQPIHLSIAGRGMPPKARLPLGVIPWAADKYLRLRLLMGQTKEPVSLVSKRAENVSFIDDDLTKPSSLSGFHVVRAANILNLGYFPENVLRVMIGNLKARLVDGGLLIVCRTKADKRNHGTIYQLSGSTFSVLRSIGEGSEVNHLITEPGSNYQPESEAVRQPKILPATSPFPR